MVLFLNNYQGVLLLLACALLLLCSALLFTLLHRQKKEAEAADRRQHDVENMADDFCQQTVSQMSAIAATLESRLSNEITRQQTLILSDNAENARNQAQRTDALGSRMDAFGHAQETRLHRMAATLDEKLSANDQKTEKLRESLSLGMEKLQKENAEKLERMRQTVDEKLHETLNRRLGESFSLVNERLEQVYKGLGEMQSLASGVGDLKKVLTNVKTRGIWGEMQLGALLEQMLAPSQYEENVQVIPHSRERVEFAIRLPGRGDDKPVYLPIDSKFPYEAYERLITASETGDTDQIAASSAELHTNLRNEAKRISDKYIFPPHTTDFAVMFLATEGLYAEALRTRGLMEEIQQKYHILIAGPSTLSALLSSLQSGFRTLAIEQRSTEVWQLLGAVKTEFGRFSELLDQTQQRLRQAGESIEKAARKTRDINRRLHDVESLNSTESARLIGSEEEV